MSEKDPHDITKIEDLPNIDRSEDDEDFQDLESMAQNLGIEDLPEETQTQDAPMESEGGFDQGADEPPEFTDQFQNPNLDENAEEESYNSDFNNDFEESDSFNDQEDDFQSTFSDNDFNDSQDSSDSFQSFSDKESINNSDLDSKPEEENPDKSFEHIESSLDDLEDNTKEVHITDQADESGTYLSQEQMPPTEQVSEKTPLEVIEPSTTKEEAWKKPEDFSEVTSFIETASFGDVSAEGTPPFSIILKNIKYKEDAQGILEVLIDHHFVKEDQIEDAKINLNRGQFLISRISEYAAIYLCHKLRVFDLEILMGLTEEINPPKSYQSNDKGLTSKKSLLNNKQTYKQFRDGHEEVITSTLSQISGHTVVKIYGIITHSKTINKDQLDPDKQETGSNLDEHYETLVSELVQKVDNNQVNGILGINFTITPIHIDEHGDQGPQYQIICSGNMVCLEKN